MKRTLIANKTNYDGPWAAEFLSEVFSRQMSACVLTTESGEGWSNSSADWESRFGEAADFRYDIERPLRSYGISSFRWYDPQRDDDDAIRRGIRESDITVLFGTEPSVCMDVLEDHDLKEAILSSPGILIVLSEAALTVCRDFENEEYYDRSAREGLGILKGAHLCMHYDESEEQLRRMIRQLEIHGGSLLVLYERSGVYLDDGHIELLGDAFIADERDLEELYSLL